MFLSNQHSEVITTDIIHRHTYNLHALSAGFPEQMHTISEYYKTYNAHICLFLSGKNVCLYHVICKSKSSEVHVIIQIYK